MAETVTNTVQEGLPELLARRARRLSDRRLAIDAGAGLLIALGAGIIQPPGWIPLLGAAVAVGASGLWGILDRELIEHEAAASSTKSLRVARVAAAVLGALGVFLLLLSILAVALGTWIS